MKTNKKGFTLIELLVVVAVIGILASVVLLGLSSVRSKGRDARRISDLKQIQNGLELYFNACSKYPATLNGLTATDSTCADGTPSGLGINQISNDPNGNQYGFCKSGTRYTLGAVLEDPNIQALDNNASAFPCNPFGGAPNCSDANVTTQGYCVTL